MTTAQDLEAIVGARPLGMMMKPVDELDEGCQMVLADAPVAGLGYRDQAQLPWTTIVGSAPGFVEVVSPKRVSFELPVDEPRPDDGSGASMVFLLPGVGETLRLTGRVSGTSAGDGITVDLEEAWVHCAKCILRSGLWRDAGVAPGAPSLTTEARSIAPLDGADISEFLALARFALITSWDANGSSDTSPKGDHPGFIRVLDSQTLAIPDRKGNRRTDTFHNLLECDEVSLVILVPGRDDVLHLRGTAFVTDDASLLSTMALGEKPPHAAMIARVEDADLRSNEGLRSSDLWHLSERVDSSGVPDLMQLGARHMARSKARGAKASMTRAVSKGLAATPGFLRRGVDHAYRKELKEEGY